MPESSRFISFENEEALKTSDVYQKVASGIYEASSHELASSKVSASTEFAMNHTLDDVSVDGEFNGEVLYDLGMLDILLCLAILHVLFCLLRFCSTRNSRECKAVEHSECSANQGTS